MHFFGGYRNYNDYNGHWGGGVNSWMYPWQMQLAMYPFKEYTIGTNLSVDCT